MNQNSTLACDGVEPPATVRGHGLCVALAGPPPLDLVAGDDAVLRLLGRRLPPH